MHTLVIVNARQTAANSFVRECRLERPRIRMTMSALRLMEVEPGGWVDVAWVIVEKRDGHVGTASSARHATPAHPRSPARHVALTTLEGSF